MSSGFNYGRKKRQPFDLASVPTVREEPKRLPSNILRRPLQKKMKRIKS